MHVIYSMYVCVHRGQVIIAAQRHDGSWLSHEVALGGVVGPKYALTLEVGIALPIRIRLCLFIIAHMSFMCDECVNLSNG